MVNTSLVYHSANVQGRLVKLKFGFKKPEVFFPRTNCGR